MSEWEEDIDEWAEGIAHIYNELIKAGDLTESEALEEIKKTYPAHASLISEKYMKTKLPSVVRESLKKVRPDIYEFGGYGENEKHTYEKIVEEPKELEARITFEEGRAQEVSVSLLRLIDMGVLKSVSYGPPLQKWKNRKQGDVVGTLVTAAAVVALVKGGEFLESLSRREILARVKGKAHSAELALKVPTTPPPEAKTLELLLPGIIRKQVVFDADCVHGYECLQIKAKG